MCQIIEFPLKTQRYEGRVADIAGNTIPIYSHQEVYDLTRDPKLETIGDIAEQYMDIASQASALNKKMHNLTAKLMDFMESMDD